MKAALILKALLIGVVILAALMCVAFFFMGRSSASGSALGLVNGQLAPLSDKPNAVSSEAGTQDGKRVAPLSGATLEQVKAAIEATGGTVTAQTDVYLAATYASSFFKFVDDVEARQDGDVVHIRSASRVGYSDRGVNAARVETIRAALD